MMKIFEQHRWQLEEMAPVLEENKKLQTSMTDLQARLNQECHRREDLEVKVLALEKEHQQMEVESQSLTKRLSHSANQQKGMAMDLALLMFSVVKHFPMVCSPGDGARPLP